MIRSFLCFNTPIELRFVFAIEAFIAQGKSLYKKNLSYNISENIDWVWENQNFIIG